MFAAVIVPIFLTLFATTATYVRADPDPNNPGPGDVLIQGKSCTIGWNVDRTGVWKTMNIDLMTGDNFNMVFLAAVGTVDGTDPNKNTFSFTCPQVTPHSPIYFYQFSSPATSNKTWTGRFAITDSPNNIVAPAQSTQPDGAHIPWGTGSLVSPSAPKTSVASSSTSGTRVTISRTASAMLPTTPRSTLRSACPLDTSTLGTTHPISDTFATPSTVFTAGTNGAAVTLSALNIVFQTGLVLGIAAFGFAVIF